MADNREASPSVLHACFCGKQPKKMINLYYYPGNANLAPHLLQEALGVPHELVLVERTIKF